MRRPPTSVVLVYTLQAEPDNTGICTGRGKLEQCNQLWKQGVLQHPLSRHGERRNGGSSTSVRELHFTVANASYL